MREILFRAWSKKLGMSSEFGLGASPGWPKIQQIPRKPGEQLVIHQELMWRQDCKIMQYTGLDDAEGKKIFGGDIYDYEYWIQTSLDTDSSGREFNGVGVVKFINGCFMIENIKTAHTVPFHYSDLTFTKHQGNKFNNPELLEEHA